MVIGGGHTDEKSMCDCRSTIITVSAGPRGDCEPPLSATYILLPFDS